MEKKYVGLIGWSLFLTHVNIHQTTLRSLSVHRKSGVGSALYVIKKSWQFNHQASSSTLEKLLD